MAPGASYRFEVCGYQKDYTGLVVTTHMPTAGVELPLVPGLHVGLVKGQGTTVKLNWDLPKDSAGRKEKWVYGIYYGRNPRELLNGEDRATGNKAEANRKSFFNY